ncbi:hypothetical protein BDN72DRAFT_878671 [Pluteus cervinus]|uniref:Uncharacterized protein n=1 Tax=Pluteus cervinus TaxID=181527 RepID=A0ACD3ATM8_9AGAR|nr:hypothetical protein BDN72DRAFT_878671 [Pluteus cervinus]
MIAKRNKLYQGTGGSGSVDGCCQRLPLDIDKDETERATLTWIGEKTSVLNDGDNDGLEWVIQLCRTPYGMAKHTFLLIGTDSSRTLDIEEAFKFVIRRLGIRMYIPMSGCGILHTR